MKGIILLNGEPYRGHIDAADALVVCCDGALAWAEGKVRIDVKAGDFDSLGYVPEGALVWPSEKNFTDGEIALGYLLSRGCTAVEIYGGGGGREDHLFGNLQLLYAAHARGARAVMHTACADIYCAAGTVRWRGMAGRTLSLAPVGERAHVCESAGLKYPLQDLTLEAGSCRGISNVVAQSEAHIVCDGGTLFVFEVLPGKEQPASEAQTPVHGEEEQTPVREDEEQAPVQGGAGLEKIASFRIDHTRLRPGLYLSRTDRKGGCTVTTFDLRLTAPGKEPPVPAPALHTLEHLGATFLRSGPAKDDVVYFGPMGCRTGLYLVLFGDRTPEGVLPLVEGMCAFIAAFEGEVPGARPAECGNWSEHDLPAAKAAAARYLSALRRERNLVYPS